MDLNPAGFLDSYANGVANGKQVGYGTSAAGDEALLWSGTAAVGHQPPPIPVLAHSTRSYASGIDAAGDVFGIAFNSSDQKYHAIEWVPNAVPEPSTFMLLFGGVLTLCCRRRVTVP